MLSNRYFIYYHFKLSKYEQTAKMFHVKHLRVPFAFNPVAIIAETYSGRTGLSKSHSTVSGAESITKPADAVSRNAVQRQAEAT
jgi:hypothetical protein